MESHISAISICLSEVNGPKGGFDKQCRLQICVANMEDIVIKGTQTDLYCANDRAMQRANRSVTRKIAQHHKRQNRRKIERVDEIDQNALSTLNNDD